MKESELIPLQNFAEQNTKAYKRRRAINEFLFWLSQLSTAVYGLIVGSGLSYAMKFFASVSLPIEIIKLASQLRTAYKKNSSFIALAGILMFGLLSLTFFGLFSIEQWGISAPVITSIMSTGPFIATAVLGVVAIGCGINFGYSLNKHFQHPELTTPLQKFELVNKAVTTVALVGLAACLTPMVLFPPLAPIFIGVMAASFMTLLVMKIVKTIKENVAWRKAIKAVGEDHIHDVLFTPDEKIEFEKKLKLEMEVSEKLNIVQKFIHNCSDFFNEWFGSAEKKKEIADKKEATAENYIKNIYEARMRHPDLTLADKLQAQSAYDVLRRTRGRLMVEETKKAAEEAKKEVAIQNAYTVAVNNLSRGGEYVPAIGYDSDAVAVFTPPDYRGSTSFWRMPVEETVLFTPASARPTPGKGSR